jgi:hypothetical protein
MKVIYNKIIPFKGFKAINLFGIVFARKGSKISEGTLNHEKIHTAQMKELLYVFFYLWYLVEYLVLLIKYRNSNYAYKNVRFEKEAYQNQHDLAYTTKRSSFAWLYF